jgi:hypothetical protein
LLCTGDKILPKPKSKKTKIEEWVWSASLDGKVCAFCAAHHGGKHPIDEEMVTHPNCRCAQSPVTPSWADLGFDDGEDLSIETGDAWLREQDEATQDRILGKAGAAAWRDGQFQLKDVIGYKHHDELGEIGYKRSLEEIVGKDTADAYKRRVG